MQGEADACAAATVLVLSDCPNACSGCSAEGAGCAKEVMFLQKFNKGSKEQTASLAGVTALGDWKSATAAASGAAFLGSALVLLVLRRGRKARAEMYANVLSEDVL